MWSPGYSLILILNQSKRYRQSLLILYGLSGWMIIQSTLSLISQIMAGWLLLQQAKKHTQHAIPTGQPTCLMYQSDIWWYQDEPFDQALILLHAGLFFLLKLVGKEQCKLLVIFSDQVSEEEMRQLRWLQVIQTARIKKAQSNKKTLPESQGSELH